MVLYNPTWSQTMEAVDALTPQVDVLCVVDNTPGTDNSARFSGRPDVIYVANGANVGIAAAQNAGIRRLLEQNCDFLIFSDQDSMTEPDTVAKLYDSTMYMMSRGIAVGIVCTRAMNRMTGCKYSISGNGRWTPPELAGDPRAEDITECYAVRSSVSMVSASNFLLVGGFDESLFIDGVDHEWCWRAWHHHRLRSFVIESAIMKHMIGEGSRTLAGKSISIPAPMRVYYQYRNYLWLRRRDYIPSAWLKRNLRKYMLKMMYYPVMVAPRMKYLHNILAGIRDGIRRHPAEPGWPRFGAATSASNGAAKAADTDGQDEKCE